MIFLALILFAAAAVDGQVTLTHTQVGETVDLRCDLPDLQNTGLTFIITMELVKDVGGTEEVLASIASFTGAKPVTHDLNGATVTSSLSSDGSVPSFINVHWPIAGHFVDGEYTCRVNGLNPVNTPHVVEDVEYVIFKDVKPTVLATPEIIEVGLEDNLTVRCFIPDPALVNISQVSTIELSYVHEGLDQLLASVDIFTGLDNKPGSNLTSVSGLVGVQGRENYLQGIFKYPNTDNIGSYVCSFYAQTQTGAATYIELETNVTYVDVPRQELLDKIQELNLLYDGMVIKNQNLLDAQSILQLHVKVLEESAKGYKLCDDVKLPVGQYPITLYPDDSEGLIRVICDVISPGDVWTVFQKRFDGSVDFYQNFTTYEAGFGSLAGEFWLGLKNLHRLMGNDEYQLRVDMTDYKDVHHTRVYPNFELGPPDGYILTAEGYDDGGHGISFNSGSKFSTYDHGPQPHCAQQDFGGWWYDNCAFANLNGKWGVPGEPGVTWYELTGTRLHALSSTEMKFKRK